MKMIKVNELSYLSSSLTQVFRARGRGGLGRKEKHLARSDQVKNIIELTLPQFRIFLIFRLSLFILSARLHVETTVSTMDPIIFDIVAMSCVAVTVLLIVRILIDSRKTNNMNQF